MRRLVPSLLLLVACRSGPGNAVDLTIVVDGSVSAAQAAAARSLTIVTSGVHANMKTYPLPSGMPKQETVQLYPTVTSGTLGVTVSVADGNKVALAQGSNRALITGKEVPLTVTLSLVAPPTVTIAPAMATVTVGKRIAFSANVPVTWSVQGGTGNGSIDSDGNYTAPLIPGSYSIVATDAADVKASQTAQVNVVDYGVTTLIGQPGGAGELDGVGGAARFKFPYASAFDGASTLFVGDRGGCVIHAIDLDTQAVTTLGGVGGVCLSTDGTLGTTATFAPITGLAYDAGSNVLFVAQEPPHELRKVDLSSKQVTTLVDPTGAATFGTFGMAYDAANKWLYCARRQEHVITKLDLSGATPVATDFAGMAGTPGGGDTSGPATLAQFHYPSAVAFDATLANLYVADTGNNEIREIVMATGATATLAGAIGPGADVDGGKGTNRLNAPAGIALNGAALYIVESSGATVRLLALSSGSLSTLAGIPYVPPPPGMPVAPQLPVDAGNGLMAQFGTITSIALDQNRQALYVTDESNSVVTRVNTYGAASVAALAGTPGAVGYADGPGPSARFWSIGTMVTAGHVVYISDNGNAVIRQYDFDSGMVSTIAGSPGRLGSVDDVGDKARFQRPEGLFVDGNTLYISDGGDSTIRAMDLGTRRVTTLAGTHQSMGFTDGVGTSARFGYPFYVTGDHSGHLYISDANAPILRQLDLTTLMVATVAGNASMTGTMDGPGKQALFQFPYGLAVESGVLFVADAGAIRAVRRDTFAVSTVAGGTTVTSSSDGVGLGARIVGVSAIASDGLGHVYFGDLALLRRYDVATAQVTTLIGKQYEESDVPGPLAMARVAGVSGIAMTPAGDLIYEDAYPSVVMLVRAPPGP
jgi:hypothetical protein